MFSGEGVSKEDEFRFPQPAVSNTCFDLTVTLMSFGVIWNQRDQEKSLIVIPQPTNRHTLAIGLLCMAEIGFYLLELLVYLFRQIIHHTGLPGIWISTTQHKIMKFVSFEQVRSGTLTLATSVQTVSQAKTGTNLEQSIIFSKDNLLRPLCLLTALRESPVSIRPTDTHTQMEPQLCWVGYKSLWQVCVSDCCSSADV